MDNINNEINNITEKTKLEPVYNGYQYLIIFLLIAIIINPIIYFFSSRKYYALIAQPPQNVIGFAPQLYNVYHSLGKYNLISRSSGTNNTVYDKIITGGLVFGIIGVMSSFNGIIYDIPTRNGGTVSYTEAQKRPFYIIIIGDQKEINQVKKNLEEQHFNDAEDKYKYTLITSTPILQNLNQKELITENNIKKISRAENFKFEYTNDNLPIYQFDTNKKNKYKFKVLNSEIIVPGSTGVSNFIIKERLWSSKKIKCKKINEGDWREAKLEDISSISQNENELTLSLFKNRPFAKLFRGLRYFYVAEIYAEKPGNLSEQTFEDWSIRDSGAEEFKEGNPVEFKTLNLTKIIKILNNVANDEFQPTLIASIALNFNLLK